MQQPQPVKPRTSKFTVLIVTTIAGFLVPFMTSAVNVAVPKLGGQFHMNVITLGWVTTAFTLASASLLVPFGKLADIYGRRRIFILGITVVTIGSLLSALSVSGGMLLATRALQGIGGAALFSTAIAILTTAFPVEERGKVLGINTAATYFGLGVGPPVGGVMTEWFGWQSIFFLSAAMGLAVIVLVLWKLHGEFSEMKKEKFDLTGSIAYVLALFLTMYGVSELPDTRALWLVGAGIVTAAVFFWWETRARPPILDLSLFRGNRGYTFSNFAALVNYSGTWAVSFLMTLYLQYIRGLKPQITGLILITSPIVQAVFSLVFGRLSDSTEPRILATIGMAITGAGLAMLAFVTATTPYIYIIFSLAVVGFGFAAFASPNTNAIMSSAPRQHYGVASATLATMRQIGMMVNMAIVWTVFALIIGRVEITPDVYGELVTSVRTILWISAGLCGVAIFFSLARGNIHVNTKGH